MDDVVEDHRTVAPAGDILALDEWEDPPRSLRSPDDAPLLAVDGFEGPLDWLLAMAQAQKIDLAQLSIAALIEAFAMALTAALATPAAAAGAPRPSAARPELLGRWGAWLVMAADLALLRSRLLLAADDAEARAARDEAETWRRRLVGRAEIAAAVDWLELRPQLGRDVFARGAGGAGEAAHAGARREPGDVTALLRACLAALAVPAGEGTMRVPGAPLWGVAQAVARMREMLPTIGEEGVGLEVFLPEVPIDTSRRELRCRAALASTFLAGLELARVDALLLSQDGGFAPIHVRVAACG